MYNRLMDSQGYSQRSNTGKTKAGCSRRSWTTNEEQCLIDALHNVVQKGLKCDNGFKAGYLHLLEQAMVSAFPYTDLKGDPHINSKIHVWKKQYGSLSTMLNRSGFGWNDSCNMIECSDDVWSEYVKVGSLSFMSISITLDIIVCIAIVQINIGLLHTDGLSST